MCPAKKSAPGSRAKVRTHVAKPRTGTKPRESTGQRLSGNDPRNLVREGAALRWGQCHDILSAKFRREGKIGPTDIVGFRELGMMIGKEIPWRDRPYDGSVTFRLESGERAIRLEDVVAFVKVLKRHHIQVDPGWLAFGDLSGAPRPTFPK